MQARLLIGTWIVGALVLGAPQAAAPSREVVVQAARFYRGDRTLVNAFVRVPHEMLSGVVLGPQGFAAFSVAVDVADAEGTALMHEEWTKRVAWSASQIPGSASVEPLAFALAPGTYRLHVVVQDSASGRRQALDLPVSAFDAPPGASDLLLAYRIRRAQGADTVSAAGEVRKGDLFIAAAPGVTLTPDESQLWYYCELYGDSARAVPWRLQVAEAEGRVIVSTPAAEARVGSGGGPVAASVDLAGLPPGSYVLTFVAGAGAGTVTRAAAFQMAGFEVEQRIATASRTVAEEDDAFARVTEARLDSMFAPLIYLGTGAELGAYNGLTVEGKRRFLRAFWQRRDPTTGTPQNEAFTGFYERIAEANRRFREGGAADVPGWRTDRGRVFIRYGEPDEVLRRPSSGPDNPWEGWKYTKSRALKFVFLDRTRVGNYSLIFTNDRQERSAADWTRFLSGDAVHEITSF